MESYTNSHCFKKETEMQEESKAEQSGRFITINGKTKKSGLSKVGRTVRGKRKNA